MDVVGIGLKDGRILLHDLKCDETLMTFLQEWGEVTSLAFRTGADFYNVLVVVQLLINVFVLVKCTNQYPCTSTTILINVLVKLYGI